MLQTIILIVCLLVISITMLARAHDLGFRSGIRWHARRIGFIVAGFSPVGIILRYLQGNLEAAFIWVTVFIMGIMLVFITTPYLPPWWRWISGKDKPIGELV